jgi:protein-S-isoprenylcysteine O-methyltransferase Ste14
MTHPPMIQSPAHADGASRIPSGIAALTQSPAYDLFMRLPVLAWSTALALVSAANLVQYLRSADPALSGGIYAVEIGMRLSVIVYLVVLAAATVVRRPPIGKASGAEPRISALIGTFLITGVVLFPRRELSAAAGLTSMLLILAGDGFAIFALVRLRHSFSIMPEARELVTSGPYRFVRHPLYLAEQIATLGNIMQFLSVWTALLAVVQTLFQLRRISNEEALLTEVFPEYAAYRQKTARVIPRIY